MRLLLIGVICALPLAAADDPGPSQSFLKQLFGPATYLRAGGVTVFSQITDSPEEWDQGAGGFGQRFASSYSRHLIGTSVRVGIGNARGEDQRYFPAQEKRFAPRLRHALWSTVTARDKETGDTTVGVGRISGAFASGFVSRLWLPEANHTFNSGLGASAISLGLQAGLNVFQEFWPKRHRSKSPANTP